MQAWRIQTLQRDSDEDEDDEFYDAEDNHTEEEEEDVGQERLDAFEYADGGKCFTYKLCAKCFV